MRFRDAVSQIGAAFPTFVVFFVAFAIGLFLPIVGSAQLSDALDVADKVNRSGAIYVLTLIVVCAGWVIRFLYRDLIKCQNDRNTDYRELLQQTLEQLKETSLSTNANTLALESNARASEAQRLAQEAMKRSIDELLTPRRRGNG